MAFDMEEQFSEECVDSGIHEECGVFGAYDFDGNDMILMPDNFEQAFEGVLEAVKDGTISESKINEAVSRILSVKIRRGILPTDSKLFRHNAGK